MDEQAVIERVLGGDAEAYGELLERYQPGLVYHCAAMVHDGDVANDMAQEACIKAFMQLKRYKPEYRFSTWLYKIATNTCLDYLKRQHHLSLDDVPEQTSSQATPHEQAEADDNARRVQEAVKRLPVRYQTVISLYYWQERSYEEIAEIMNAPLNTVRTWIRRAKEQLQEELDG
jgi:RNA polymerase sigma-70 factor (ECF subfamily)